MCTHPPSPPVPPAADTDPAEEPAALSAADGAARLAPLTCLPLPGAGALPSSSPDAPPSLEQRGDSLVVALGGGASALLSGLHPGARVRCFRGGCVVGLRLGEAQPPTDFMEVAIGQLRCRRLLALARCKLYWMVPGWGRAAEDVPPETQLLLLELEDEGGYALLAPLIDGGAFRSSLRPPRRRADPPSSLVLRVESGAAEVRANAWNGLLYAAAGQDPFALLDAGVAAAAALSGSGRPRTEKPTPACLDCFGWCTWDAFYIDVCPAGIRRGLASLAAGGTPARVLIIDDGWQHAAVDPQYKPHGDRAAPLSQRSADRLGLEREFSQVLAAGDLQAIEPLRVMQARRTADRVLKERPTAGGGGGAATAGVAVSADATSSGGRGESGVQLEHGTPGAGAVEQREPPLSGLRGAAAALLAAARRGAAWLECTAMAWLRGVLEDSSSDSVRLRAVCSLAVGPLRHAVLRFYAASSWHSRRLLSLAANAKFSAPDAGPDAGAGEASSPHALGQVVAQLKAESPVPLSVFCWHAMMGYWSGLMPGAPALAHLRPSVSYPRFSPGTLEVDPSMTWSHPAVAGVGLPADGPEALHAELHAYLSASGVSGVKVDCQATISAFPGSLGFAATSARWHASLEASAARHLAGGGVINSMCNALEDLYNMSHSNIARVGEDFYPMIPASHAAFIANSAFNTLFVGAVAFADWDMFHSDHGAAHLHACARAVSGGMVYVSDGPGEHDFPLLRRLVLPDGTTLRALLPGRPTADCLFADVSRDGRTVLKVWNLNPCGGVVACFNVQGSTWSVRRRAYHAHNPQPPALEVTVRPVDVPALPAAERYAVYSDALREVRLLARRQAFPLLILGGGGHDVLTLAPVLEAGGLAVAAIGLRDMINAGGAVLAVALEAATAEAQWEKQGAGAGAEEEGGNAVGVEHGSGRQAGQAGGSGGAGVVAHITVRGCGAFLMHASQRPRVVEVDGVALAAGEVEWEEGGASQLLTFPLRPSARLGSRQVVVWF